MSASTTLTDLWSVSKNELYQTTFDDCIVFDGPDNFTNYHE